MFQIGDWFKEGCTISDCQAGRHIKLLLTGVCRRAARAVGRRLSWMRQDSWPPRHQNPKKGLRTDQSFTQPPCLHLILLGRRGCCETWSCDVRGHQDRACWNSQETHRPRHQATQGGEDVGSHASQKLRDHAAKPNEAERFLRKLFFATSMV